jgi:predicted nucleic-acid-binding protein
LRKVGAVSDEDRLDSNVLLRVITQDEPAQSRLAEAELAQAEAIAVGVTALCELGWVLRRGYRNSATEIARVIRWLLEAENVIVDAPAVEAGLAMLDSGGDFADGVIAFEGRWLGGENFVSFDRDAVQRVQSQGHAARLPGG